MRIVSLLPSTTEIICDLGFEEQIVGRSHECNRPKSIVNLPEVTTSKVNNSGRSAEIHQNIGSILKNGLSVFSVNIDLLAQLQPDIVFTQDHCEFCAVSLQEVERAVKKICGKHTEVVSVSPKSLSEIYQSIKNIGQKLGAKKNALNLVNEIRQRMDIIRSTVIGEPVKRVLCLEWIDPLMTGGNWIPELLEIAGAEYVLAEPGKHSPKVHWQDIMKEDPDVMLIIPCGYNIRQTINDVHILAEKEEWNACKAVQDDEVYILDGNLYFNRPGISIFESTRILAEILHPGLFKPTHKVRGWIPLDKNSQRD